MACGGGQYQGQIVSASSTRIFSHLTQHAKWLRVLRQTICPLTVGGHCLVLCVCAWGQQRWKSKCLGGVLMEWGPVLWPGGNLKICCLELWAEDPFPVSCQLGATFSNQRLPLFPMVSHSFSQPQPESFLTLIPIRLLIFPSPNP